MEDNPLAIADPIEIIDVTSAIVSETDAAGNSSDEEESGWLTNSAVALRAVRRLPSFEEENALAISQEQEGLEGVEEEWRTNDDTSNSDNYENSDEDLRNEADNVPDDLYCANMDDEDEAWVYKHMRSGQEELVSVHLTQSNNNILENHRQKHDRSLDYDSQQQLQMDGSTTNNSAQRHRGTSRNVFEQSLEETSKEKYTLPSSQSNNTGSEQSFTPKQPQMQQVPLLKPRTSDAILSCPRCFTIVCMDCQQHDHYANQYRAMFVMNIGVDWKKRLVYDDVLGRLKLDTLEENMVISRHDEAVIDDANMPDTIPHDFELGATSTVEKGNGEQVHYYPVNCGFCQLEVAALDLKEEIYYFFGCIASA